MDHHRAASRCNRLRDRGHRDPQCVRLSNRRTVAAVARRQLLPASAPPVTTEPGFGLLICS